MVLDDKSHDVALLCLYRSWVINGGGIEHGVMGIVSDWLKGHGYDDEADLLESDNWALLWYCTCRHARQRYLMRAWLEDRCSRRITPQLRIGRGYGQQLTEVTLLQYPGLFDQPGDLIEGLWFDKGCMVYTHHPLPILRNA